MPTYPHTWIRSRYKFTQVHAGAGKTRGGGVWDNFNSAKKSSADRKELNTIISSTVYNAINIKKRYKSKLKDESD